MLIVPVAAVGGCTHEPDLTDQADATRISLALNWFPEAEHGGFFAADASGYFADQSLRVKVLDGGPGAPVIQQVATGRVEFAVANADQVLLGRDQGAPVVAVLATMQTSPRCIMVRADSGIRSFADLDHVTLAVGAGKPFARFLLNKLAGRDVTVIPYQGNVTTFLARSDVAQQAYVFSEPYVARQQGTPTHCLMIADLGYNPYTSLLITSEEMIRTRQDVVARTVTACLRGWQAYMDDPRPANRLIAARNPQMDGEVLAYGADAIRPWCAAREAEGVDLGMMTDQRWQTLAEQLGDLGLLKNRDVWKQAYTARFLTRPTTGTRDHGPAAHAAQNR